MERMMGNVNKNWADGLDDVLEDDLSRARATEQLRRVADLHAVRERRTSPTNSGAWYAVMVAGAYSFMLDPRQPIDFDDPIAREGFNTFVPTIKERIRLLATRKYPKTEAIMPALPGYVFVEMPDRGADWAGLGRIKCVRGVVAFDGAPARLKTEDLNLFAIRVDSAEFERESLQSRLNIRAGDRVNIVCGTFFGHEGEVEKTLETAEGRVARMLISLFNTQVVARVPVDNLEKLS